MVYVSTVHSINDLVDLLVIFNPLLEESDFNLAVKSSGRYKKEILERILKESKEESKEKRRIGNLEKYILSNSMVFERLNELRSFENIIFPTGISVNQTEEGSGIPRKLATDPHVDSFLLSTKLLRKSEELPEVYETTLFLPVAPVLWPNSIKDSKLIYLFPDVIEEINNSFIKSVSENEIVYRKKPFGSLIKTLETRGNIANFEFYEEMFDLKRALYQLRRDPSRLSEYRNLSEKELELKIGYEIHLNKLLMAIIFSKVVKELSLKEINLYAMNTSYAKSIFEKVSNFAGIRLKIIGDPGCMRNTEKSVFGESDDSAISLLHGFLKARYDNKHKITSKVAISRKKPEGKSIELLNCFYYPFYLCPFQKKCDSLEDYCEKDQIEETFDKKSIELLNSDAKAHYYGIRSIENLIFDLCSGKDFDVLSRDNKHYSWLFERNDRMPKFFELPKKEIISDLRASGFSVRCDIARIIGQYKENLPLKIEKNELAIIGDTIHKLSLTQPVPEFLSNKVLGLLGLEETTREKYCEKEVVFNLDDIRISGHFDSAFLLGNDICVLDIKRDIKRPYPKISFKLQLLSYALAITQELNIKPENYYLVLVNRPFEMNSMPITTLSGLHKPQDFTIIKVEKNDPFIGLLEQRTKALYSIQQEILHSRELMQYVRDSSNCEFCFSDTKQYCDYLFKESEKYKDLDEMLKSVGKL